MTQEWIRSSEDQLQELSPDNFGSHYYDLFKIREQSIKIGDLVQINIDTGLGPYLDEDGNNTDQETNMQATDNESFHARFMGISKDGKLKFSELDSSDIEDLKKRGIDIIDGLDTDVHRVKYSLVNVTKTQTDLRRN